MADQIQELKFQVGEAWKGAYNSTTAYSLANVVQDPTGLSIYRSLKSGNVGHPLTDGAWWFLIIDLSGIKTESDRIKALNDAIAEDEALRVAAEELRQQKEAERIAAETQRNEAEQARITAEQQRVAKESQREAKEQQRISAEQDRVTAESARVQAEQARALAETLRTNAEDARAAAEANRNAAEQQRIEAEQQRITQEQTRQTKEAERQAIFELSQQQRTTDFNAQMSQQQQAFVTSEASRESTFEQNEERRDAEAAALQTKLESGEVVPALAGNLEAWEDNSVPVENNFDGIIRTTAGDDPINSKDGGTLASIEPMTDFKCTGLLATAENQLRLKTNGGGAVAVGAGWYFPVPKLTLGQFGTADENNGLILVDSNGNNITNATVYFKPMASGVPTSVTDGTAATSQNVTYKDKTYKVYTTSGPGYLIVSGITYADTCARIAWEDWYDKFVSPTDPTDVGGSVNLAPLFAAAPNGSGKFLVCGNAKTTAERISASQWLITDPIGRITSPAWTDTPDEVEEGQTQTYTHSLIISDIAAAGTAMIEGSSQSLSVNDTTVSYSDTNATAIEGVVRYEKAVAATATVNLASAYTLNDVGVEMKEGVEGSANFVCEYTQNIADSLAMAPPRLNDLRSTAAAVGLGSAVCSTGTYDSAKMVTIPHFMLLDGAHIDVLFTTPINTELSTLNVSLTGAKPIRILGQALPAGVVKAQTYATLVYDGTAWNIVNLFCPDAQFDPAGLIVDMGLPSGVKWASRDIDLTKPGGFCDTPFVYEKSFFSWGNIDGHNPISNTTFDYNWGSVNETGPYYENQPYGSTPGNTLTGNIAVGEDFDAARANLGAPWRMPTNAEFAELFVNIRYITADGTEVDTTKADKRVTVNGVTGLYIESKLNGARLFFSCSGRGTGRSRNNRGSSGYYWSSTWNSARNARNLDFYSGGVYPHYNNIRYYGFAVRPVQ